RIFTGRKHQARRHLKHISHPVIGDANHGKGPINREYRARYGLERMALHARSLSIVRPNTNARVRAIAQLPPDLIAPLLRLFGNSLAALTDVVDDEHLDDRD